MLLSTGCCALQGYTTPPDISRWQDPAPPRLSLAAKATAYQERLESRHLTPEGLVHYALEFWRPTVGSYGNLADGPFHTGIYLASQAQRLAATGAPEARVQVLRALGGLRALLEVTGKRGLLARYFSLAKDLPGDGEETAPPGTEHGPRALRVEGGRWFLSAAKPGYAFRADASKDQYAGFVHGLGTALAVAGDDPEIRRQVAELASAAADHLLANDLRIVDVGGSRTTHGNLSGRIAFVPIGVNALIALSIIKVAAVSTGDARYEEFYRRLIGNGYAYIAYWAHFSILGVGNRVNDNMAYLALHPLFLLEEDRTVLQPLWEGERRTWEAVRDDRNAFFAFAHAAMARKARLLGLEGASDDDGASLRGREALVEFPDEKVAWPVDLTREGFGFPRAFLNTRKCAPRTTSGVPLYLRPRASSFWASDPFRLVGNLKNRGDEEYAGADYLLAYWMARRDHEVKPEE
jgi:hypothetical protein